MAGYALADPLVTPESDDLLADVTGITEADFDLDLRVVESALPSPDTMCSTGDGCGATCRPSACNSVSSDPF
jgi:FxLD family lantipeptide